MSIRSEKGQSLAEFAMVLPLLVILGLGVIEVSFALLDQHGITKLTREGANLISRDTTLQDAAAALRTMSGRSGNFDSGSKVIFSVIRRGASTGTANFDRLILSQRYEFGSIAGASTVRTQGGGSFGGPPDYAAANSDGNANLRVTSLPNDIVVVRGGMLYVTEIYATHRLLTPFDRFGIRVPTTLYSIAYF